MFLPVNTFANWARVGSQYTINKRSPLFYGLAHLFDPGAESMENIDRVGGLTANSINGQTSIENDPDLRRVLDFDGAGDYIELPPAPCLQGTDQFTLVSWMRKRAGGDNSIAPAQNDTTDGQSVWDNRIELNMWNDGDTYFQVANGNENQYNYATVFDNTDWHCCVGRFYGPGSNNAARVQLWVDGVQRTLTYNTTTPTSTASSHTETNIGLWPEYTEYADGFIGLSYIYEIALSEDTIRQLYQEPFALFKPSPRFWAVDLSATTYFITPSGSVTPAGALTQETAVSPEGSISPAGALLSQIATAFNGLISPGGAVTNEATSNLAIDGTITPSGEITRETAVNQSGNIGSAGDVETILSTELAVSGTIATTGEITQETAVSPEGTLTPSGDITQETAVSPEGTLTPSGDITQETAVSPEGTLTPSGDITQETAVSPEGTLTPSGDITQETAVSPEGSISPAGALLSQIATAFNGTISPTGSIIAVKTFILETVGAISPTATLTAVVAKAFDGEVSPTAIRDKMVSKTLTGSVTPSGLLTASLALFVSVVGSLSPTGDLKKDVSIVLTGTASLSGSLIDNIALLLTGTVSPVGNLVAFILVPGGLEIMVGKFKGMARGRFKRMK